MLPDAVAEVLLLSNLCARIKLPKPAPYRALFLFWDQIRLLGKTRTPVSHEAAEPDWLGRRLVHYLIEPS